MPNIGEEICGEYLKNIEGCDFITYNITNPDIQGEIDVIGIKLLKKEIYVCESAVHTGGLQYVSHNRPDDYARFLSKFNKDIQYAKKYFNDYVIKLMLWSPVVKVTPKAKYNTYEELQRLKKEIQLKHNLELQLIINEAYSQALLDLKNYVKTQTAMMTSPVMRVFQIEQSLEKHLNNLEKKNIKK
ncbi:hypothetical protein COB57_00935 [Candidatus Peregrinibacteria bacterium]|nr:MAG: hypothetical protein COB57_00935 [Candidatus Peregrinibacteria bacterium]